MGGGGQLRGDLIAGKYEIVQTIGVGGMAIVLEARHVRLGTRVALKVLQQEARAATDLVARFEREARAVVQLHGRNVARVLDVDLLDDGSPFIVMEHLEGADLADELASRDHLPVQEAVGYVLEACAAMTEAHALGIIHRDLKPANLFLARTAEGRTLKVLDFGISKVPAERDRSVTTTQSMLGTPQYMSPEQARSTRDVDARADVWSLGVILFEALAGCPPFVGETPSAIVAAIAADEVPPLHELRPEVPTGLVDAVLRALEKDPAVRFQTVDALAAAIAPFGPAQPASSAPDAPRPRVRPLRLRWWAGVAALVAAGIGASSWARPPAMATVRAAEESALARPIANRAMTLPVPTAQAWSPQEAAAPKGAVSAIRPRPKLPPPSPAEPEPTSAPPAAPPDPPAPTTASAPTARAAGPTIGSAPGHPGRRFRTEL